MHKWENALTQLQWTTHSTLNICSFVSLGIAIASLGSSAKPSMVTQAPGSSIFISALRMFIVDSAADRLIQGFLHLSEHTH